MCALLVTLEFASLSYTASVIVEQSALGVMQSVSGEVSGRLMVFYEYSRGYRMTHVMSI